jgi:hypothetical protein
MRKRIITTLAVVLGLILTLAAAYSAGAFSSLPSINPVGVLAAAFAAVVGFAWFLKNH